MMFGADETSFIFQYYRDLMIWQCTDGALGSNDAFFLITWIHLPFICLNVGWGIYLVCDLVVAVGKGSSNERSLKVFKENLRLQKKEFDLQNEEIFYSVDVDLNAIRLGAGCLPVSVFTIQVVVVGSGGIGLRVTSRGWRRGAVGLRSRPAVEAAHQRQHLIFDGQSWK